MDAQPGPQPDSQPAEKPRRGRGPGRPFTKNDPRIRQNLEATEGGLSTEERPLLEVMRHVTTKPRSADWTHQQREWRQYYQESKDKFMARLLDLEEAAARAYRPEATASAARDEGTGRARELIERLLKGEE